jgi:hypothetical protein
MDWSHYIEIIKRETEPALQAMFVKMERERERDIHVPIDPNRLIRNEWLLRKATDTAIRHWIKCRKFQFVNSEIADYIHIRFNSALYFLEEMKPLHPKVDVPEKRVLTWLLIRRWRTHGRAVWICYMFPDDWPA